MEKVKLSTLSKDETIYIEDTSVLLSVGEVLEHLDEFRDKELYTTVERYAGFNAKEILNNAIENECSDEMYEDWAENIKEDIEEKDIKEIQVILNRILARNPEQNMAYVTDKLIEIDV